MWLNFLPASAVAELGAWQVGYSRRFNLGQSDGTSATTVGSGPIPITGGLHFFTERLSISYPTIIQDGSGDIDDYVSRIALQISTNTNLSLFTSPVPLQLIAVPGRQPTAGVLDALGAAAAPGQAPHIPGWPWNSFIPQGTDFLHTFASLIVSHTAEIPVDVFWQGWNIPADRCPSESAFWAIVKKHKSAIAGT